MVKVEVVAAAALLDLTGMVRQAALKRPPIFPAAAAADRKEEVQPPVG
jgi:hypothetical protein